MQKKKTDTLYIVGLYIVAKEEFINERCIQTGKFLDWIVAENISDNHELDLIDLNNGTRYYGSGFQRGDLYVDYETLSSYTCFTNKNKLSIEEINYYLQKYKENDNEIKMKNKKIIYEMFVRIVNEIENEKAEEIMNEVMKEYGEEETEAKRVIEKVGNTLDIIKKKKVRKR